MPVTMPSEMPGIVLKVKKLDPAAVLPTRIHPSDAGFDLTAIEDPEEILKDGVFYLEYRTGLAIEIPAGHVGYIFPRSSIRRTVLTLSNCVGVIDSGYRGEITFSFKADGYASESANRSLEDPPIYRKGDRIGQLIIMPLPQTTIEIVDELSEADRGDNGYGSTGK